MKIKFNKDTQSITVIIDDVEKRLCELTKEEFVEFNETLRQMSPPESCVTKRHNEPILRSHFIDYCTTMKTLIGDEVYDDPEVIRKLHQQIVTIVKEKKLPVPEIPDHRFVLKSNLVAQDDILVGTTNSPSVYGGTMNVPPLAMDILLKRPGTSVDVDGITVQSFSLVPDPIGAEPKFTIRGLSRRRKNDVY